MNKIGVSLCLVLLMGCELSGTTAPTTPTTQVQLSDAEFDEYWRQLERRWPAWFVSVGVDAPALPDKSAIRRYVHFVEVPAAYVDTCTFGGSSKEIKIGDDKWQSGCVPHELGHAALHFIDGCWRSFEHPGERCE